MLEKVFAFIFGTCIGSFLNVCIFRLPKEKSLNKPRSSCPKCGNLIRWYDNIPILSYIFLKGRCRNCKERISLRYPLVEVITGFLFLSLYLKFGLSFMFVKFVFLFCLLIVVSFIDIDYYAIPAYLCVFGIVVGLFFSSVESFSLLKRGVFDLNTFPLIKAFKDLVIALGFAYLFKLFGDVFVSILLYLRKQDSIDGEKESLGLGDVDFMGVVGVFLGWQQAVFMFFVAPFLAVVYSVFALIFKKSHIIPYLPYLSLATLVVFFWGNKILSFIF